jgi:hypothetical protein
MAKVSKQYTSWLFHPSLNNPTVELNKKLSKKNTAMFLPGTESESFLGRGQAIKA